MFLFGMSQTKSHFTFWDIIIYQIANSHCSKQALLLTIHYVEIGAFSKKCESQTGLLNWICNPNLFRWELIVTFLLQTFLLWQLAFSTILLGRRYSWNRIAGCLLVAAGVITAVARYYHFIPSNFCGSRS